MTIHEIRIPIPTPTSREETLRRIDEQIEAVWIKMMAAAEEKYPGILEMALHLDRRRCKLRFAAAAGLRTEQSDDYEWLIEWWLGMTAKERS